MVNSLATVVDLRVEVGGGDDGGDDDGGEDGELVVVVVVVEVVVVEVVVDVLRFFFLHSARLMKTDGRWLFLMGTASSSKDGCFVLLEFGIDFEVVEVMRVVIEGGVGESRPPSLVFSSEEMTTGAGVGGRWRSGLLPPEVPFLFLTTRILCLILVRSGSRSMTFRIGERAASASALPFAISSSSSSSSVFPPSSGVDPSASIRLSQSAEWTAAAAAGASSSDRRPISTLPLLSVEFSEWLLSLLSPEIATVFA